MNQYIQAPHVEGPSRARVDAPNAALLIDFDNVTMGMRSDLSKELKSLLQSDIIRGKVTVQRAYADWRRYPQYIVPLSEASVDLIFAPAYGSSKKNATDIRMAIDGVELVFTRPEIGTFILLTGDSDFSSLVLKLKEYGKYVIGVGIQESSSDILVQNCDEYYSYTSLTGLRKTTEISGKTNDPWDLVERAMSRMTTRGDVMRSDRLKQVMLELDARFSEGNFGFSKFSKFVAEAASRGLVRIHKLENGQYEVKPGSGRGSADDSAATREPKTRGRPAARRGRSTRAPRGEKVGGAQARDVGQGETGEEAEASSPPGELDAEPLRSAYDLMVQCLQNLREAGKDSARDSDVKRKMLALNAGFDEGELGFGKFSRFLLQAEEHGVISLEKTAMGNYRVSLAEPATAGFGAATGGSRAATTGSRAAAGSSRSVAEDRSGEAGGRPETPSTPSTSATEGASAPEGAGSAGRLGPRGGSGGRREGEAPVLLEGQIVGRAGGSGTSDRSSAGARIDAGGLGLPTSERAIISYLTNSYGGVGKKTAESLVEAFGADIFVVFETEPGRVAEIVPRRAHQVLAEWKADFARRSGKSGNEQEAAPEPDRGPGPAPGTGSVDVSRGSGLEDLPDPSSFRSSAAVPDSSSSSAAVPDSSSSSAAVPDFSSSSAAVPDSSSSSAPVPDSSSSSAPVPNSSSSSAPVARSGGARRRTRPSSRRPPSSDSGE